MSDLELKPCPFCGGEAHIIKQICLDNGFVSYEVSHSELNCCMKIKSDTVYHIPEEAARAWNKRAENECMPAADVHAERHGRWIRQDDDLESDLCSECGAAFDYPPIMFFCPICGAKMDGKDGDNR